MSEEYETTFVSKCHLLPLRAELGAYRTDYYCPECGEHCGFFADGGTLDLEAVRAIPNEYGSTFEVLKP